METVKFYFPNGNYKKIQTSGSVRFSNDEITLNFGSRFVGQGLIMLIVKVRMEVQKNYNEDAISPVLVSPEYFGMGELKRKSAAVEVDLTKAYLTAAFKIGAISERTYDRLNSCAKTTRLMVLGSLATKRIVDVYEGGVKTGTVEEQNQDLKQVWLWIVAEVDKTMRAVSKALGKGFLYYWCDAAFVKSSHVAAAKSEMEKHGYGSKVKAITSIRRDGKKVYILDGREFPVRREPAPNLASSDATPVINGNL